MTLAWGPPTLGRALSAGCCSAAPASSGNESSDRRDEPACSLHRTLRITPASRSRLRSAPHAVRCAQDQFCLLNPAETSGPGFGSVTESRIAYTSSHFQAAISEFADAGCTGDLYARPAKHKLASAGGAGFPLTGRESGNFDFGNELSNMQLLKSTKTGEDSEPITRRSIRKQITTAHKSVQHQKTWPITPLAVTFRP